MLSVAFLEVQVVNAFPESSAVDLFSPLDVVGQTRTFHPEKNVSNMIDQIRDRCYDFAKKFAEKFANKMALFDSKHR
jgi:hypothetical protein